MKQNSAEILKTNSSETESLKQDIQNARLSLKDEEMELHESEEDARSLELMLQQIQSTHENKEEAEKKGKETSEKIQELAG